MGVEPSERINFGGLEEGPPKEPLFGVLPVPYDLTTSYVSGARSGPGAIIEASTHMELYDEELKKESWRAGIETFAPVEVAALSPKEMIDKVYEASLDLLDKVKVPVLLGGEHSISYGLLRAISEKHADLSVLQLDAHADLRDTYEESPYNHACVARRISEHLQVPIVQLGVRSLSTEEAKFMEGTDKVKTFFAKDIIRGGTLREGLAGEVCSALTGKVFITIDLDVFDPSVMPSTGTPEPGGLSWYDVTGLLRDVIKDKEVVGFDVVELSPMSGNVAPDFMAAKLVYKLMGYISEGKTK